MNEMPKLSEGDIYRWSYAEPGDDRTWGRYHCKSQIAVVSGGRLRDTYWQVGGSFGSDSCSFGSEDFHRLNLTFLGNLNDLEKRNEADAAYYDSDDVVNLNHANSSKNNFYIRKGAKRSAAKMMESANRLLEEAKSDIRCAEHARDRALANIARIQSGDTSGYL